MLDSIAFSDELEVPQFQSCWGCCHVKQGTLVLGVLELVAGGLLMGYAVHRIQRRDSEWQQHNVTDMNPLVQWPKLGAIFDYISLALLSLLLIVILCLFYALMHRKKAFLLPHLLAQALILIFSIVYFSVQAHNYFHTYLQVGNNQFVWSEFSERMWLVVIYLIIGCLEIYIFYIVCSYYRYLTWERLQRYRAFQASERRVKEHQRLKAEKRQKTLEIESKLNSPTEPPI